MRLCNVQKIHVGLPLVLFVCFAVPSPLLGQGYEIVPVARPGDMFLSAFSPSLNGAGQVAFVARHRGLRLGLYLYDSGEMVSIAQGGDPADRCEGTLSLFGSPSLNSSGQIAFSGGVGVFLFERSQIRAIVCSREPAPGGGTLAGAFIPAINNAAQVAFYTQLDMPDDGILFHEGVFFYDGTQLQRIAATGDAAPGGGSFVRVLFPPSVNDAGQVAFAATVSPPGRGGIFLWENGELQPIVQAGDPAPGGGTFSGLYRPLVNNSGQVVFFALLLPIPETPGVFVFDAGELRTIVPFRDPETGDEILASRGLASASINDLGQIAFEGSRSRNSGFVGGMFLFDGEGFRNIVLSGDPMPGGGTFLDFFSLSLNSAGQVAFTTRLPMFDASAVFLAIPRVELEPPTR